MRGTIELLYGGWKEISARTQPTLEDYADRVCTLGDDGGGLRGALTKRGEWVEEDVG